VCLYIYIYGLGRAQPRKRRADLGPKMVFLLFLSGPDLAHNIALGQHWSGPNPMLIICRNVNNYCSRSACNQMVVEVVDGRSEVGGNLAEEKELLSLAWREVSGGAGGRNGDGVGCLWRRKKEKDAEEENLQRGEGRPRGGCNYRR